MSFVLHLSDTQPSKICVNDELLKQNHFICPYFPYKTNPLFSSLPMAKYWQYYHCHVWLKSCVTWTATKLWNLAGHIIGHEGPGSLLSELKRRGWVSSLMAGSPRVANGFAFFKIDVDLSEGRYYRLLVAESAVHFILLQKDWKTWKILCFWRFKRLVWSNGRNRRNGSIASCNSSVNSSFASRYVVPSAFLCVLCELIVNLENLQF